ncbi:OmpA family protein [Telmatobacter sp. DSM 110680]|uniref:OmpA family protein n=1 Tax=Telmatobacter sp. DSM 110680 TaxID=3036704 RepID=A0AAU7DPQ3_9BACT
MFSRISKITRLALTVACASVMPIAIAAQDAAQPPAAPAPAPKAASAPAPSKWDLFAGYSYLAPKGSLVNNSTQQDDAKSVACCADVSLARYFSNYFGVQIEGDFHKNGGNNVTVVHNQFAGGSGGLIVRLPTSDITPFVHALIGGESVSSTYYPSNKWGMVLTAGGGVDYNTPLLDHHLAIRVFQADYQYTHENMYPVTRLNLNMARLSTGVVVSFGSMAPPPTVTIACAAQPTAVFQGEPVAVTATVGNQLPKDHVIYSWSGNGVTGTDTNAKVDTSNLAPGSYTVNCGVKEGKPGKEGLKPWESASGTATFTVKEFEPPTLSCSANPTDLKPGDSSTITSQGVSPQNRPLTYTYQASGGTISGSGTTATYSSTGAQTGPVQITCSVSDDKSHTATANTSVTIQPPPPPPGPSPEQVRLEARLALHSIFFPTAQPREKHPEGGLVESQQTTLTTLATDFKSYLQFKPDAHLTLTGHTDPRGTEKYNQALSERRVNRAKDFLVSQGISASAIDVQALGESQQLSKDEVKALVESNPEISDQDKKKVLRQIQTIYLAQNRRVDITLANTGQQSVKLYPFNAADSATLLDQKAPVHGKKKAAPKK